MDYYRRVGLVDQNVSHVPQSTLFAPLSVTHSRRSVRPDSHANTQTRKVKTMYQLENVNKTYERRGQTVTALDESTLSLAEGEFIALVGPSGSGKTTLLSMLGGTR